MVAEKTWLQMCPSTMSIVAEHFYHQEFETKITKIKEEEACVKNVKLIWIELTQMASLPPTWFGVELWSASCVELGSKKRPSYIFSLTFSKQRYRGTWMEHTIFIYLVCSLNKDREATTLWIEHMTLSQQRYRYRGNNIVDRTHHPLSTKYRDTDNNIVDRNILKQLGPSWKNSNKLLF